MQNAIEKFKERKREEFKKELLSLLKPTHAYNIVINSQEDMNKFFTFLFQTIDEIIGCLPEGFNDKCLSHNFFKDDNPPECFNCGKTKDELTENKIINKCRQQFLDNLNKL